MKLTKEKRNKINMKGSENAEEFSSFPKASKPERTHTKGWQSFPTAKIHDKRERVMASITIFNNVQPKP
jgi:hypothetical protein